MKTIARCVTEIIREQPYLEEALEQKIVNYSALAGVLQTSVSSMLRKPVKQGAIVMALRRYQTPAGIRTGKKIQKALQQLGDITVRSNICAFTFQNTPSLIDCHGKLLAYVSGNVHLFYAFTRGILESNIMISGTEAGEVTKLFSKEKMLNNCDGLAAVSVQLPHGNDKISGLYYQLFKHLAWRNIALYEVVSTTNEFTVLVEDRLVEQTFATIKGLK